METYFFQGRVTDYISGAPIVGAQVDVEAGFFTFVVDPKQSVGGASTDDNGFFSVQPCKNSVFDGSYRDYYQINITWHNTSTRIYIYPDTVRAGTTYNYDIRLTEGGYLKFLLNNVNYNGPTDSITISGYSNHNLGQQIYVWETNINTIPPNSNTASGDVHGYVTYSMVGDDTFHYNYRVVRSNGAPKTISNSVFVKRNDTTEVNIAY